MPNIACVQSPNTFISNSLIRACVFQIPTASNQFPILSSPNPYPHYYLQVSMQQTQWFKIYENNSINNFHTLLHQTVENKLFSLLSHYSICGKYYCCFKISLFISYFQAIVLCQLLITTQCCIIIFYLVFFFRESSLSPGCQMNRKIVTLIP